MSLLIALCVVLIALIVFYIATSDRAGKCTMVAKPKSGKIRFPAIGTVLPDGSIFTEQLRNEYEMFGVGNPFFVTNNGKINAALAAKPTRGQIIAILNTIMEKQLYNPYSPNNYSLLYPILNSSSTYQIPQSAQKLNSAILAVCDMIGEGSQSSVANSKLINSLNNLITVLSQLSQNNLLAQLQADAEAASIMGPRHRFRETLTRANNQLAAIISQLRTCAALLR